MGTFPSYKKSQCVFPQVLGRNPKKHEYAKMAKNLIGSSGSSNTSNMKQVIMSVFQMWDVVKHVCLWVQDELWVFNVVPFNVHLVSGAQRVDDGAILFCTL